MLDPGAPGSYITSMTQPHSPDIRLYSKVRKTLQNLMRDPEQVREWKDLYIRLSNLKSELEVLHPNIARLAPDDPRDYEGEEPQELS